MPSALPENAAGHARYCKYVNSACSARWMRSAGARDRNVLGLASRTARLRVEQRRVHRERRCAGAALALDVVTQRLVVLNGHMFAEVLGRPHIRRNRCSTPNSRRSICAPGCSRSTFSCVRSGRLAYRVTGSQYRAAYAAIVRRGTECPRRGSAAERRAHQRPERLRVRRVLQPELLRRRAPAEGTTCRTRGPRR